MCVDTYSTFDPSAWAFFSKALLNCDLVVMSVIVARVVSMSDLFLMMPCYPISVFSSLLCCSHAAVFHMMGEI